MRFKTKAHTSAARATTRTLRSLTASKPTNTMTHHNDNKTTDDLAVDSASAGSSMAFNESAMRGMQKQEELEDECYFESREELELNYRSTMCDMIETLGKLI